MVSTILLLTFLSMAVGAPQTFKMMVSTILLLTFLSMAVGAPQKMGNSGGDFTISLSDGNSVLEDEEAKLVKRSTGTGAAEVPSRHVLPYTAPPPENLLGQYIFTTYHLLLKEIRNKAEET